MVNDIQVIYRWNQLGVRLILLLYARGFMDCRLKCNTRLYQCPLCGAVFTLNASIDVKGFDGSVRFSWKIAGRVK